MGLGRVLIVVGLVLVFVGMLISFTGRWRLPGDIMVRRGNFTLYFPIVTSIVLSVLLTLVMWLFNRR
jgi:hypothetical protein